MAIQIRQYTPDELLLGLAEALVEAGMFDTVWVESGTLYAEKGGITLFNFTNPASPTYAWHNKAGAQIFSGYASSAASYTVSTCGKSVMMTFASGYTYNFVFGQTREGSVYMGFTYNHQTTLTNGQLISFCENTSVMYDGAFQTGASSLWSRLMPICVQSGEHTVETVDGIYGFVERYTGIPVNSPTNITPTRYSMNGIHYLTDGSFVLEDDGGVS